MLGLTRKLITRAPIRAKLLQFDDDVGRKLYRTTTSSIRKQNPRTDFYLYGTSARRKNSDYYKSIGYDGNKSKDYFSKFLDFGNFSFSSR